MEFSFPSFFFSWENAILGFPLFFLCVFGVGSSANTHSSGCFLAEVSHIFYFLLFFLSIFPYVLCGLGFSIILYLLSKSSVCLVSGILTAVPVITVYCSDPEKYRSVAYKHIIYVQRKMCFPLAFMFLHPLSN